MSDAAEIRHLLTQYLTAMDQLRPHGIKSIADFPECLFAVTLGGDRVMRGRKGHDVLVPDLGRVQVKERRLPADGRMAERLHLKNLTCDSCDHLAAVIFANHFTVTKATLAPHADVWRLIQSDPDPEKKVRFDLIARLATAVDMTHRDAIRSVGQRSVVPTFLKGSRLALFATTAPIFFRKSFAKNVLRRVCNFHPGFGI
jgi:hypothetical protein